MLPCVKKLIDWDLYFFNGAPSHDSFVASYPRLKSILSSRVRRNALVDWEKEVFGGGAQPTEASGEEQHAQIHKYIVAKTVNGQSDLLTS